MSEVPSDEWISTSQAANLLGRSPDWVRRQIRAGLLPARVWRTSPSGRPTYRIARREMEVLREQLE